MASSMLDFLKALIPDAIDRIVFPDHLRLLLEHLSTAAPLPNGPAASPIAGDVQASANDTAGGFANLDIDPLGPAIAFELRIIGTPEDAIGFQFDLKPADGLLRLPASCRPAKVQTDAGGTRTLAESAAGGRLALRLNGADPLAVRIEGSVGSAVRQAIVALDAAGSGIMTVSIEPQAFMLGSQGFGIHLPGGLTIDSSPQLGPGAAEHGAGHVLPSEAPAWQGVALRKAELFLPSSTPLVGSGPIPIELELGLPQGLFGHTKVHVPAQGSRPALDVTLTWNDPGATSLASALPTGIEVRTSWDLDQAAGPAGVGAIEILGGRPLRVTSRFARIPGSDELQLGVVVEAGGDQGLLTVKGTSTGGKVVVTAAALATAFIADAEAPDQPAYDGFGATLHGLLVAASGLSAFVENGSVTVHAVEIEGGVAAAGAKLSLRVDYSVDVKIRTIDLGFMSIGMKPEVPMRLRYKNVRLLVDFAQAGLDRFHLSFGEADIGVEDPGGWQIESPGSLSDLFDVLGSRSGHGSQWFEIDLRFALDLGPVEVSGATIRVTLGPNGALDPHVRGLEASFVMPKLFAARGKASLGSGQLDLAMAAEIIPLNIGAFASLSYGDCEGYNKLAFALGVDLPGPIPLANSGLGLYGLGGIFGVNAKLRIPEGPDLVEAQLQLKPLEAANYDCAAAGSVFGLGAVIGTAPDLGFTFSAGAVIVVGLPDFALRASLDGKVLGERMKLEETGGATGPGARFKGLLSIADDGVTIALRGHYSIPVLFTIDVPFGAYFPSKGPADRWFLRLGSDGIGERKSPGPIQARILPDLLDVGAWAYLMIQGDGIANLGGEPSMSLHGFALGFGAGFNSKYGVPLVHLELSASAVVGIGTNPFFLAGKGHLSGSLHLGPVSIGVSAEIMLQVGPAIEDAWVRFKVCGEVDLFFFSLKGCVTIEIGSETVEVPEPTHWPLRSIALADHLYTKTANAARSAQMPSHQAIPVVWPDAIPILQFTTGPLMDLQPGPFTDRLKATWNASEVGNGVVGNERLNFTYALNTIDLTEIDPETLAETPVAGPQDAAWQAQKGTANGEPGARELALLTWETTLWTRKLADGGVDDPYDPIKPLSQACRPSYWAQPGWALGLDALRPLPSEQWRFSARPSPEPFAAQFDVFVSAIWWEIALDESTVALLPYPFPVRLVGPTGLAAPLSADGQQFLGALDLPHAHGIPEDVDPGALGALGELPIVVTLTFSRDLQDPMMVLLLPYWPSGYADERLQVELLTLDGPVPFTASGDVPGTGSDFMRIYKEGGGPFTGVRIAYPAALVPRVLGVRGVTTGTAKAAEAATNAAKAAGQAVAEKAETLTPRPMLKPNKIYRIDVVTGAMGRRAGVSETSMAEMLDTYWFRTADMNGPAPSAGKQYLQGQAAAALAHYDAFVHAPSIASRTDRFDPAYLERYILDWMPRDRARFWFLDDPVGVHMAVKHLPDLAWVYGHDTRVKVRRTDPTRGNPDPFAEQEITRADLLQAAVSIYQPKSDIRLYELTSVAGGCPYPPPGATMARRLQLQPLSQYEAFLDFPFADEDAAGVTEGARIAGGVFSTSRYRGPRTLLGSLGFGNLLDMGLNGDIEVSKIAVTASDVTADGALEAALEKLEIGRRRVTDKPRSSGLWCRVDNEWRLHGVLLEAPEPIHRPDPLGLANFGGRLLVKGLSCGGDAFEQIIRSASGDRILFLTANAFRPAMPLRLAVTRQDIPLESATAAVAEMLDCRIRHLPRFLEDLG